MGSLEMRDAKAIVVSVREWNGTGGVGYGCGGGITKAP